MYVLDTNTVLALMRHAPGPVARLAQLRRAEAVLVTSNIQQMSRVAGLLIEDWSASSP